MTSAQEGRARPPRRALKAAAPVAGMLAGRSWFPIWAVIHHVGRKSGKRYATPIAIIPTRSKAIVLIGLPWGASTNWAQNVLAAGGATLTWKGREVATTNARLVDTAVAAEQAKPIIKRVVGSGRFPAFLLLDRA